jgi:hypothetical protein
MEAQQPPTDQTQQWPPGWYTFPQGGGIRYFDGTDWTDHFAPPPALTGRQPMGFLTTVLAVFIGVVLGWAAIWGGSKVTDDIYFPVKVEVDTPAIPGALP